MVWAGITATGKTPLIFLEKGVRINAQMYQDKVLRGVVEPWTCEHFKGDHWVFQQDWAPAHGAKTTIALCKDLFPEPWGKEIWCSNSPDLNLMEYAVWSILEKKACAKNYATVDSLKQGLLKAWDEITVD